MVSDPQRMSMAAASSLAAGTTIVTVLPVFLAGGLAVQMAADLDFSTAALGAITSAFVGTQALAARRLGRWADQLGATRALRGSCLLSAAAAAGIAGAARGWIGLAVALAFAGAANSLGQPAANRLLSGNVAHGRQGVAFGLFQSSKPVAGILAGLSVPAFALTVGWRWAFAAAAGMAIIIAVLVPGGLHGDMTPTGAPTSRPTLRGRAKAWLVVGIALGFGTAKVFSTFLVDASVVAGFTPAAAGLLLTLASTLAMVTRIAAGIAADRWHNNLLRLVVTMMVTGAIGFALLVSQDTAPIVVGAVLCGIGAWGYNGVFYLAITRLARDAPAKVAGAMLAGASTGGLVLPLLFGYTVARTSYPLAWSLVALAMVAAATAIQQASLSLQQSRCGKPGRLRMPRSRCIRYTFLSLSQRGPAD